MTEARPPRVLCVSTGNLCRSAAMELILRRAWKDDAEVTSAGTYAMVGCELPDRMVEVLLAEGLDPEDHDPRELTPADISDADLVLVAATEHRGWIAQHLGAVPHTVFLLTEAAALTPFAMRPPSPDRSERIRGAAAALDAARAQLSTVRQPNILDPFDLGADAHRTCMSQVLEATSVLLGWLG